MQIYFKGSLLLYYLFLDQFHILPFKTIYTNIPTHTLGIARSFLFISFLNIILRYKCLNNIVKWGTRWPSGLTRRLRCSRSRVRSSRPLGGIFLRASHGVRRIKCRHPPLRGMAETYGCPNRNSATNTPTCNQPTVLNLQYHPPPNGLSCRGITNKKKKIYL